MIVCLCGCFSANARLSGTGINVQDSTHFVDVQANSVNGEIDVSNYK